ncbi:MAG: hypothetical protein HY670_04125 [Chloroflexi bacterium]|nr:hypothetical protein [Chloroflexota bacterium]
MKRLIAVFLFLLTGVVSACSLQTGTPQNAGTGTLEGKVTIGPLTPVERPGVMPTVPPEVYAARKIVVYEGTKLVRQVDIDNSGKYKVALGPGTYTVDINRIGIDHSKDLPKQVEIRAGQTVRLDVAIDTGIR